jgi:hypothetical protein
VISIDFRKGDSLLVQFTVLGNDLLVLRLMLLPDCESRVRRGQ